MSLEDNPTNRTSQGSWNGVSFAKNDSFGHIPSSAVDIGFLNLRRLVHMQPGVYAVCFRRGTAFFFFIMPGISAKIQNVVVSLVMNEVSAMMAHVPKTVGIRISCCLEADCVDCGSDCDFLSLIAGDLWCDNPDHDSPLQRVYKSGLLAPVGDLRFFLSSDIDELLDEKYGLLGLNVFPVFFRRGDRPSITTGLTLRVHADLLSLITNDLMPHNCIRTALPNATGANIAYYTPTLGIAGQTLSLIWDQTQIRKCDVENDGNNPEARTSMASGYCIAGTSERDLGTQSMAGLRTGIYQLCFAR